MQLENTNKVLTVSELTLHIKTLLEKFFLFITLKGEISNFKLQSSGHMYFSLKDENSQISCVLFKGNSKNISKLPKDGDQVIIEAQLTVYPPRGNYQLIIKKLSYEGVGQLLFKLHELKEKLKAKGWFDSIHKKPLPFFPKKIGVVTSPTGSVIQDILNVLKRRFSNFHLILNPVKVQGESSAKEIAKAIEDFNKYNLADVLIIGRGGGSLEDLWAFNEEIVAKAIFESTIPVISAVGHETDVSISDFVADIRAPTPSAAAEIVIKEKAFILETLKNYKIQILKTVSSQLNNLKIILNSYKSQNSFSSPYHIFGKQMQLLDEHKNALDLVMKSKLSKNLEFINIFQNQINSLNPKNKILEKKQLLFSNMIKLDSFIKSYLEIKKERALKLYSHLKSIDPKNLLKKGYSILFTKNSSVILSTKDIKENEEFYAMVSDGKIYAKVKEKK